MGLLKRLTRSPDLVVLRFFEIIISKLFLSYPVKRLRSFSLSHHNNLISDNRRYALVAHVFYIDIWSEIIAVWSVMPPGTYLIVTVPSDRAAEVRAAAHGLPLVEVHEYENRGRDIAPFIALLNDGQLDRFDVVLKIHTKKSPHLIKGDLRRKLLFSVLAGSTGNIRKIIAHFDNPRVGLVGFRLMFRTNSRFWMYNRDNVERLCRRMQPNGDLILGFFEGSMFWFRPSALAPIRSANLQPNDFDLEYGQTDGTLHHSLERAITISARAAGFDTISINGHLLMEGRRNCSPSAAMAQI